MDAGILFLLLACPPAMVLVHRGGGRHARRRRDVLAAEIARRERALGAGAASMRAMQEGRAS